MKNFNESKLKAFLEGQASFDLVCLENLFLIACLIQKEKNQLAIWVDSDIDANPVSIEIFDDAFGTLDSLTFQSEYLNFFCQESDFIQSELIEWDDEDETGQNEIYFVDEDLDLNSIVQKTSLLKMSAENLAVTNAWHSNLKQFVLNAI